MAIAPFMGYQEYKRVYSVMHITADGTYKEDNIPGDYKGSILTAEVVHQIILVSPNGELTKLDFETKRLVLDMLNIKVWLDGHSVEITGVIPVMDDVIVTTQS